MCFSSTPRGARLARRMCGQRLDSWGVPYGSEAHDAVTLIAAELCANAVRHGHVSGRDFRLDLSADPVSGVVRVEVSDTLGERLPGVDGAQDGPHGLADGGRGLLLVAALADRWGCCPRACGGPGKTVWARYALPGGISPLPRA